MKMEFVQKQLKEWGEIIVTTAGGATFELHLADTEFDTANRVIVLKAPTAQYVIDGDQIEFITKHYGHKDE
ncbi:MAG: hypothetical protein H0Z37_11540 [Firmicutes bacterium]|nr:hypothetical protein [Bacillota bacterium]